MRWNDTAVLLGQPVLSQDAAGNVTELEPERADVFCNAYSMGASAWAASVDIGLMADAVIQLRSCDYGGQQQVEYRGERYDVERVTCAGEFTKLQLGKRVSNG